MPFRELLAAVKNSVSALELTGPSLTHQDASDFAGRADDDTVELTGFRLKPVLYCPADCLQMILQ